MRLKRVGRIDLGDATGEGVKQRGKSCPNHIRVERPRFANAGLQAQPWTRPAGGMSRDAVANRRRARPAVSMID